MLIKGTRSLRDVGVHATWQRVLQKLRTSNEAKKANDAPLFTNEELDEQRNHSFPQNITFSIVVPLYNTPRVFLRAMIESVLAQTYANWELCMADGSDAAKTHVGHLAAEYVAQDTRIHYRKLERNLGISGNTNACLEMATGDYIALLDHDDVLHPAALFEVARAICELNADFIYTDESTFHKKPSDANNPHFKPAFAPDTLRANNYICHFTVFKRGLFDEVGLFNPDFEGAQDYDMILRLTECAQRIAHVPEVLYYWRAHAGSAADGVDAKPYAIKAGARAVESQLQRLGLEGAVEPIEPGLTIYRTRYALQGTPRISILIPTCEHRKDLKACLDSIFEKTTYPDFEVIILENNSSSAAVFAYYEQVQAQHPNVHVITWQGRFSHSAINNFGARNCTGDYLVLLNNDTQVITPDWLQEMLMFAQREDVGIVGAKLYYPDDTIQHAGLGIGLLRVAGHFFQGVSAASLGYMGRLIYAQNLSAATGACSMIRRNVWVEMGGFDESFPNAFNDVDLCLRIRKAGYLVVWTPFAELYHYESKSFGKAENRIYTDLFIETVERFCERWKEELDTGDPYYNPNFTLDAVDFRILPYTRQYNPR